MLGVSKLRDTPLCPLARILSANDEVLRGVSNKVAKTSPPEGVLVQDQLSAQLGPRAAPAVPACACGLMQDAALCRCE